MAATFCIKDINPSDRLSIFQRCSAAVSAMVIPQDHLDYKAYLEQLYRGIKNQIKGYTYLEFAYDLGFSHTNVIHRIIKGKRPLTPKAANRIAAALDLAAKDHKYFVALSEYHYTNDSQKRADIFKAMLEMKNKRVRSTIAKGQLAYFNEWFHPVVREMMSLKYFKSDASWIARKARPHIRKDQAEASLKLLQELGLAKQTPTGAFVPDATTITTGDEVRSMAIVGYHMAMIDLARNAITTVGAAERDISAITIAINPEMMRAIKAEIQTFRKKLLALSETVPDKSQIYQVNFQLFPLTY